MLTIKNRYIYQENEPFYWLGDTAWLIFYNLNEEEIVRYLKNRAILGYNVIQAVLLYSNPKMRDVNEMPHNIIDIKGDKFWNKVKSTLDYAKKLGIYFALLPMWRSIVKNQLMTDSEIFEYMNIMLGHLEKYDNIIWVVGGDVRGDQNLEIFNRIGLFLKKNTPDKLVTFHPFGRTGSYLWFNNESWLDFNMFQSGHRRYDQLNLSSWDDNNQSEDSFGEDNYKYVRKNFSYEIQKPCLDAEPSYEGVVQGLHDNNEPYWETRHVRRYLYWSILAGACGFTYGNNAIIQFNKGETGSYGVRENWEEGLHSPGAAQMQYLFKLMKELDFTKGRPMNEIILNNKFFHHYSCAFGSENFILIYTYKGDLLKIDLEKYANKQMSAYFINPENGSKSYINTYFNKKIVFLRPTKRREISNDWLILFVKE